MLAWAGITKSACPVYHGRQTKALPHTYTHTRTHLCMLLVCLHNDCIALRRVHCLTHHRHLQPAATCQGGGGAPAAVALCAVTAVWQHRFIANSAHCAYLYVQCTWGFDRLARMPLQVYMLLHHAQHSTLHMSACLPVSPPPLPYLEVLCAARLTLTQCRLQGHTAGAHTCTAIPSHMAAGTWCMQRMGRHTV